MRKQLEELQCSFDWDRVSKSVYCKQPYITRLGRVTNSRRMRWPDTCHFLALFITNYLNATHKGLKYLPIIEHIFYCITHFSCQILSFIHAFVLHTNRLNINADNIPELGGFLFRDFRSKYHNLDIKTYVVETRHRLFMKFLKMF
jgi:hypothetical protein